MRTLTALRRFQSPALAFALAAAIAIAVGAARESLAQAVTAGAGTGSDVPASPKILVSDDSKPASPKILVSDDSKQLTLQGVAEQKVSRVVSLSVSGDSPAVTDLKFVAIPLTPTEAGGNAMQEPEITWEPKVFHLRPGEPPVPLLVTVSLKGLSHGEYKSALRLVRPVANDGADTHVETEIPMVIKVHHDWQRPLSVLAAGVAMGMFFSWFRATGKDRDVALTGRDGLVSIANDQSRPKLLTEALSPVTADIDDAISRSDWAAAQAAVVKGEAIVYRWRRDKTDWEFLNDYLQKFQNELNLYPQQSLAIRTIDEQISRDGGKLASAETTDPLRNQLNLWRDQVELFRKTEQLLGELTQLRDRLPAEKVPEWSSKENVLVERLDALAPDDKLGFATLQADLSGVIENFNAFLKEHAPAGGIATSTTTAKSAAVLGRQTSDVPGRAAGNWAERVLPTINWLALGRASRLKIMGWFGYLFPAGVFVYTGLSQLYLNDPTFGSLGDYASLFLWGFGSDAGGSKLQDLMRQGNGGSKIEDVIRQAADRTDVGSSATPKSPVAKGD